LSRLWQLRLQREKLRRQVLQRSALQRLLEARMEAAEAELRDFNYPLNDLLEVSGQMTPFRPRLQERYRMEKLAEESGQCLLLTVFPREVPPFRGAKGCKKWSRRKDPWWGARC
jgi:hypothetical protein